MDGTFDILPCGYLTFKDSGVITATNSTISSWLGYPREEMIGKSIESIFTIATRIFYNTHFFPLIKLHSKASEIFLSLKDNQNKDIPVLANATRIIDGDEHIIHCVFIRVEERKKFEQELLNARREAENALRENRDLSELTKSLEQQALELDKQYRHQMEVNEDLMQFSKIISHDLQEPIRKIQIFIDAIANDPGSILSDKGKAFSTKIDAAARKLKVLTKNLQEYIVVDTDKVFSNVNLNSILDAAKFRAVNLRQFTDFDMHTKSLPEMEGYEKQLELLFFHLIDNAIQFRDPSRKLVISVDSVLLKDNVFRGKTSQYRYQDHVRIIFQDNGIGFSEEYSENVFQLFKKLDTTTSGLGIGLPLVKKITQNHSGDVHVSSRQGEGTRFEIQLPLRIEG